MYVLNRKERLQVAHNAHTTNANFKGSQPISEIAPQMIMRKVNSKVRYPSFMQNCLHCLTYYLDNSNIHGLRFLAERKRTIVEKIFWILILSTSLYICVNLILQIYNKWQTSPVSPGLNKMISLIQWNGKYFLDNFTALFQPVVTHEGLCYSFNMLNRKELFTDIAKEYRNDFSDERYSDWNPDLGYSESSDEDAYPRRTLTAGPKGGLTLKLFAHKKNIDYACGDSIRGFKVALHQPSDFLHLKQNFFWVPLGHSVVVAVKPTLITTSETLRNYGPFKRMCMFISEKSLKFFKFYSQLNCLFECVTNFTLRACGCVSFHMPRENSTPICGPAKKECMEKSEMYFMESEIQFKIKKTNLLKLLNGNLTGLSLCGCLTPCSAITFDSEISQADENSKHSYLGMLEDDANKNSNDGDNLNEDGLLYADLNIFFKETMFLGMERNELYGLTDFWSSVGGIMGLFMGFSFVSIFEIVYYFTVRLCCNAKMFGRRYWAGSPKELEEAVVEETKNVHGPVPRLN